MRLRYLTYAGGMFGVLLVHVALSEARIMLTRVQYVAIVIFVTSFLGVGYEIAEFLATMAFGLEFQSVPYDTWYDIVSNTVGIASAAIVGVFLYPHQPLRDDG